MQWTHSRVLGPLPGPRIHKTCCRLALLRDLPPSGGGVGNERGPARKLTGDSASGTVKFFNSMKGFGFIQRDDGQPDAFVHISAVERAGMSGLNEGDRLDFDLEVDRRGKFAAVNLQPKTD